MRRWTPSPHPESRVPSQIAESPLSRTPSQISYPNRRALFAALGVGLDRYQNNDQNQHKDRSEGCLWVDPMRVVRATDASA